MDDWRLVLRFRLRALRGSTFAEVFRQKRAQRTEPGRVGVSDVFRGSLVCYLFDCRLLRAVEIETNIS